MRTISRSRGNTVNALAYFSGTSLYDEKTGQWFYHDHKEVAHVELLLPQDAPSWAKELKECISSDRTQGIRQLSEFVESAEKRKDARLYREFEFALPRELTNEQNIQLAREFLQDQVCGRGMAVVANFHFEEDETTGEPRPHCHALMMTRRLRERGFSEKKETDWDKKDFLLTLREQLAAYTNFHLKLYGHDIRIDHRSYAEQGIDIEPQPKLARNIQEMENHPSYFQKKTLDKRLQYELTRQRNVAKLIKRPETVLDIVTGQQSTFMWGDVEKVLMRYVREEDIFDSLKEKLQSSRELVLLREEERVTAEGTTENASIYTTQTMLTQELSLVHLAEKLGEAQTHDTREEDVEAAINRANAEFAKQGSSLSQDQTEALHHITQADQLSCMIGYAGAGKSTTFKAAKEVWEASGYKVYGLAPTGRAAQNLEEIGLSSQTLHQFLKDYDAGRSRYHQNSVLVLDEAGMVDVGRFNDLLQAVDHLDVKLVISGNGAQAQPIEAGPGFRLVTDRLEIKKIETVVRQKEAWQQEATRLFGTYHTRKALEMYLGKDHVQFVEEKVPDLDTLVSQNRHQEVVELYNLSRRICGNMWQFIADDLKEQNIPQDQILKTAVTHEDFALFKHRQEIRNQTAVHMKDHLDTYRGVMTEKGVDPVAFAALFVEKDLSPDERQQEIRKRIKEWKLDTPHPLTPLHQCDLRKQTREAMVQEWAASLKAHPGQSHLMVTYTNRDTYLLNEDARHLMRRQGVMDVAEYFHTVKRESTDDFGQRVVQEEQKTFSRGERIVFTRNDRGLKVKNGTLGTIDDIDPHKLMVRLDGDNRVVSFASNLYPYFDRGWAITIIKSQGSTADYVFKLATFDEDRNLAYVGMTRHRASLQVFGSTLDFWKEEVFVERLSRSREKLSSLDYLSPQEAQRRINPPVRLREALSSLGSRLESWGYYSRKGWESVCERFLGKSRSDEMILFPQNSVDEAVRARDMGVNAAPVEGGKELSGQEKHTVGAVGVGAEFTTSSPSSTMRTEDYAMDSRGRTENASSVILPSDVSAFVDKQAVLGFPELVPPEAVDQQRDISQKNLDSETEKPFHDVTREEEKDGSKRASKISLSQNPYYSLKEVRENLTPYSIESLCTRLLGEPHKDMSNKRHLRYGVSGALAVSLSSSSPGLWKDHSRDEGGDIFKLVQRERGGDFKDALAWVAETLHVTSEPSRQEGSKTPPREKDDEHERRRLHTLNRFIKSCQTIEGTLAQRYLREQRGIQRDLSSDLRFIPSAWNEQAQQSYPALAAIARDKDRVVTGIQMIFLNEKTSGKADCAIRKKSFGILKGSSVQIQKEEGAVFLAEGIETALSIREAGVKGDIYAVLGSENFKNASLFLEDKSRPVIICADQDGEESQSAKVITKAVAWLKEDGRNVSGIHPTAEKGKQDFNDVLKREGVEGVRSYFKEYVDPVHLLSERQRAIFSELEKSIEDNKYFSEERKQKWIQFGLKDPHGTLISWNNILVQQEIMEEQRQGRQELYARLPNPSASPSPKESKTGGRQTAALPVDAVPARDNPVQEILEKVRISLPQEEFRKLESDFSSSKPEALMDRCKDILNAREEALKIEAAVSRFIELSDKVSQTSVLVSGEAKEIFPVLEQMCEQYKNDERFEQRLKESGNRQAAQRVEQYHIEQKRLQTKTQGYALEI